jgi:peptidase E
LESNFKNFMELYLFGGYGEETEKEHWELVMNCILTLDPSQILYLGFAENRVPLEEKFKRFLNRFPANHGISILDANVEQDLMKADSPLIYVGGGNDHHALFRSIADNPHLKELVFGAKYYFGDSAGSMVVASRQRSLGKESPLMDGIGLLQDTIIEPHYTQKGRQQLLRDEMTLESISIGIGVDEAAGIKVNTEEYPDKWKKLGINNVELIYRKELL